LHDLYGEVEVPGAVEIELSEGSAVGADVPDIRLYGWLKIVQYSAPILPYHADLGKGESEVIALGLTHSESLLVLDDKLARSIADLHDLSYTGTLGVLIKAKQAGIITEVSPILTILKDKGMWINDATLRIILSVAGEG
jgi:predicted nucleic acid-binding protein